MAHAAAIGQTVVWLVVAELKVMARWIALGITLVCLGSCSFMSQSVFRGMVAPVGAIVFGFVTLLLFVHVRVVGAARPPAAAILDPETQMLMRQRAARLAEKNRAESEARQDAAGASTRPPGTSA